MQIFYFENSIKHVLKFEACVKHLGKQQRFAAIPIYF